MLMRERLLISDISFDVIINWENFILLTFCVMLIDIFIKYSIVDLILLFFDISFKIMSYFFWSRWKERKKFLFRIWRWFEMLNYVFDVFIKSLDKGF